MSIEAISWVSRLQIRPSSVKFVLLAFADCSNELGICFPSIDHLCMFTSQDRKTVINAISKLEAMGYLSDTGERRGRTRQVKVYGLKHPETGTVQIDDAPKSLKVPDAEQFRKETVPNFPLKSPVFPREQSRFSAERVPKTGHGSVMDPSGEPSVTQDLASLGGERTAADAKPAKGRALKRCPPDFQLTPADRQWAAASCPGIDLERETEKFRDHTFGTARSDWPATWRNWMRNALDRNQGRRATPQPTRFDQLTEGLRHGK